LPDQKNCSNAVNIVSGFGEKGEYMKIKTQQGFWNPYIAGALSGIVLVGTVWISGKFFGASTTFVRSAGMIEKFFSAERVAQMDYFMKEAPVIDWQWMFVIGIFFGALLAAKLSGTFAIQALPDMWRSRFGAGIFKRACAAFFGGIIAMFGARLADGCPSGHGLSGSAQLAVSGFIALVCFFIGGVVMARILYRGRDTQ
jgi:uncharacterized protein